MFSVPAAQSLFSANAVLSPEYLTDAASIINPTSLQEKSEVNLTPVVDEEDEDDEETVKAELSPEPQSKQRCDRSILDRREPGSDNSSRVGGSGGGHNMVGLREVSIWATQRYRS